MNCEVIHDSVARRFAGQVSGRASIRVLRADVAMNGDATSMLPSLIKTSVETLFPGSSRIAPGGEHEITRMECEQ